MKKALVLIICLSLCFSFASTNNSSKSALADDIMPGYVRRLVWSDEFVGDSLNTRNWNYVLGSDNELGERSFAELREQNCRVKDGMLDITSQMTVDNNGKVVDGSRYTGKINTNNKYQFLYGDIEIRAKVSKGMGVSSIAYLLGAKKVWPKCGEVDLFQYSNQTKQLTNVVITPLFNNVNGDFPARTFEKSIDDDNYHVFKMSWTTGELQFYIDDKLAGVYQPWSYTNDENMFDDDNYWPFKQSMYLNLTACMWPSLGGELSTKGWNLVKTNVDSKDYETHMYVDYVRVYQVEKNSEVTRFEKTVPVIKKAVKKKSSKKIKIVLKRPSKRDRFSGFSVRVFKSKKKAKKDKYIFYQRINKFKTSFTISKKKFKNKKNLYIRVKYYKDFGGICYYSKYSKLKKIKIKKK